jgi:hemerythrin
MDRFNWDDSLSVGVKLIDEQHKVWIERLNALSEAIESHKEAGHISRTLNFMMDYVEFHFAAEEGLMAEHSYPGSAHHKHEHQKFREILMDLLVLELEEDQAAVTFASSIHTFQVSWLKEHIQHADRLFAAFLQEKAAELCSTGDLSFLEIPPLPVHAHPSPNGDSAQDSPNLVLPKNPAW